MSTGAAVLVIAGTDASGGAGLVRDVQTLAEHGIRPLCAVTAVTAQTDAGLVDARPVEPSLVRDQILAALATTAVGAIKIGMLGTGAVGRAVAEVLPPRARMPIVLDPVLVSSSGGQLCDEDGLGVLRHELLPRLSIVTPNLSEAAALLGEPAAADEAGMLEQAQRLSSAGPEAVLLKGGHGSDAMAVDVLVTAAGDVTHLRAPRVAASLRGTGCAMSSAVAAGLARGQAPERACEAAKAYVARKLDEALRASSGA